MNLTKMFETQRVLDERIEKEHPTEPGEDRFNKKILSLLVELGECANEERSWKFWSNDQEPRVKKYAASTYENYDVLWCVTCGDYMCIDHVLSEECDSRAMFPFVISNPLLEEFADCIHFLLGIGNDKGWEVERVDIQYNNDETIEVMFNETFLIIAQFYALPGAQSIYNSLLVNFFTLGHKLGFTPSEIESAYYAKNKVNHDRQENGY